MGSKMGYYNVDGFIKQKGQDKEVKMLPTTNLLAAADHIRKLFEGKKFGYAFMGGLEMLCLGHRRESPDLQIAYDDKDFHKMKSKLESDQRIRLPEGMNSLFPAKVLIRTGPAYKGEGCTHSADVEVDLVPPGSHGTPSNGSLARNTVLLSLKNEGKLRSYKGLNMLYLVKTLVHYCRVRDLAWDPNKDLLFLCQHYSEQVQSTRTQLDQKAMQQNFLAAPFFAQLPTEDQWRCYLVLLGTEPPPTMAITPPPPLFSHKHSASDPDPSLRPRLSSHQSSPSLNRHIPGGLLSPPLPGKPRSASSHLSVGGSQASEVSTSPNARVQKPSELSAATRESRSRYRQVSAPNTRKVSPVEVQNMAPMMGHVRQRSQPPPMSAHRLSPNALPMNHLQPPSRHQDFVPGHPREFINNHSTGISGPVPPYAFAQTPALHQSGFGPQQYQHYMNAIEISVKPIIGNPGQQHLKSQLGVVGNMLSPQNQISNLPITPRPIPPPARPPHKDEKAELPGAHTSPTPKSHFYIANPNKEDLTPSVSAQKVQHQPPAAEPDTVSLLGHFIAELSAENTTTKLTAHIEHHPPATPPEPLLHHDDISIRPLNPRAPSAMLPTSLIAGGSSLHQRTTSTSSVAEAAAPVVNASRYTRYYATPPESPPSTYKAYQPGVPPPMSPPGDAMKVFERSTEVRGGEGYFGEEVRVGEGSGDSRALAMEYQQEIIGLEQAYTAGK
ncbi:hypothetical protein HBI56_172700 [Parastagonospora nodorum]|nr:hypothetical protein HBH49_188140 [Parastagonospora nodorum]KAH4804605.1 hypothetical protein HBH61_172370 [Parastagonospora nodorum]KAH5067418.1 hypothetical protein HBH95_196740 [Parastagonospora nodorum]KAH5081810.1 hypothetical protein HBI73_163670 [Parastagonospora nodorum]KAH5094499.1 hypothetical protein HBH72_163910 [Parastagonospora nodorum]